MRAKVGRAAPHGVSRNSRSRRYARLRGVRGFFAVAAGFALAGVRDFDFGFAGVRDFEGVFGFDAFTGAAGLVAATGAVGLAAAAGAAGAAGLTGLAGGWGGTTGCSFCMRTRCCHWKRWASFRSRIVGRYFCPMPTQPPNGGWGATRNAFGVAQRGCPGHGRGPLPGCDPP